MGDFRRERQVRDARFDHPDTSAGQAFLDFPLQVIGDFLAVAAQRQRAGIVRIVRIARRHRAQRRLALDVHEVFVVVDLEQRLRSVDDLPDDDCGNLDRIAIEIVDLEFARLEIANAQGHAAFAVERIGPARTGVAHGADVAAEELQHFAFVRRDGEETGECDQQCDAREDCHDDRPRCPLLDRVDQPGAIEQQQHDQRDQRRNTRWCGIRAFVHGALPADGEIKISK